MARTPKTMNNGPKKKPVKKIALRKTEDGTQLYSSQRFRTGNFPTPKNATSKQAAALGKADAGAKIMHSAKQLVAQNNATRAAKKRMKKPMGGK